MQGNSQDTRPLGVIVVTFNAEDVILDCLESLLGARGADLRIVVVDNASDDGTLEAIRAWAAGTAPYRPSADLAVPLSPCAKPVPVAECEAEGPFPAAPGRLTVIRSSVNRGFAGGVNLGLVAAAADRDIKDFWILNPDSITLPETPARYATCANANSGYGLMGGRTCYMAPPDQIQIDGGTVNFFTGVTHNINLGCRHPETPAPESRDLDFVTGANLVVSRAFYESIGPMREDYFLYYEEVDWALRRGDFPLLYCPGALVHHRAGTAIGSPTLARFASPFSLYFKYRSRMKFIRRFRPLSLPVAYLYALAKAAQIRLGGGREEARALVAGLHGRPPPEAVRARLSEDAARLAFGG